MSIRLVFLAVVSAGCGGPASAAGPGPVVVATAAYPGASAAVADEAVAGPLAQQITGVEGAVRVESESRPGEARVVVRFAPGTDADRAQVLVQNRVALAEPILPAEVRRLGVTTRKGDPDEVPAFWLAARDGKDPSAGVTRFVRNDLRDRVCRLSDVRDASVCGGRSTALSVGLDPAKLAEHRLTVADVARALEQQNLRSPDPKRAAEIILATRGDKTVRLSDVGTVGSVDRPTGLARVDADPVVLLAVQRTAGRPTADRIRAFVVESKPALPAGSRLELVADLSGDAPAPWVRVELRPAGESADAFASRAGKAADAARATPGCSRVVAHSDPDRPDEAELLIRYEAGVKPDLPGLRDTLRGVAGVTARVHDLSGPTPRTRRFPVEVALCGPDAPEVRRWAEAVRARLAKDEAVTDLRLLGAEDGPGVTVDIDRDKVKRLGLELDAVIAAVAAGRSPAAVIGPNRWAEVEVEVWLDPRPPASLGEWVRAAKVRTAAGESVPLGAVVSLREGTGPTAVRRVGTDPAMILSANPPAGATPAAAVARVRATAERVRDARKLPAGYAVVDLTAR